VLIDPPYSVEYAESLYGTDYPRPSHLLKEAARVVVPGGRVGILHFLVPFAPKGSGLEFVAVRGVTTGLGYRIRAWTLFARQQANLPHLEVRPYRGCGEVEQRDEQRGAEP
jgi:ubiquinone/menaquinone biosynthesis C-methylase UbiE